MTKQLTKQLIMDKNLAYILGVIEGDGYVSLKNKNYIISLGVIDKDFALTFKKTLEDWSGFKVNIKFYKNQSDTYQVSLSSKYITIFLKNFNIIEIKKTPKKYKAMFLKGMYDSEGSVNINAKTIILCNCNKQLLQFCKSLLLDLGIKSNKICIIVKKDSTSTFLNGQICITKKDCYALIISGKENLIKFKNLVGFNIKRKQYKIVNIISLYLTKKQMYFFNKLTFQQKENWRKLYNGYI